MVQTDTYAKILMALAALAGLSFLFGIILYIILWSSSNWYANWYLRHFNGPKLEKTLLDNTRHVAAGFVIGAIISLFTIEMFSQYYLVKRQKHEYILTHLQMQLENKL